MPALLPRLSRALLSIRDWVPCTPFFPLDSAVLSPSTAGPANQQNPKWAPLFYPLSQIFGALFPIIIHNQSDFILCLTGAASSEFQLYNISKNKIKPMSPMGTKASHGKVSLSSKWNEDMIAQRLIIGCMNNRITGRGNDSAWNMRCHFWFMLFPMPVGAFAQAGNELACRAWHTEPGILSGPANMEITKRINSSELILLVIGVGKKCQWFKQLCR